MRPLLLALAAVFLAASSFFGPAAAAVQAQGGMDLLPTEAELNTTLAPFAIANYKAGPGTDGWDGTADFDITGSPEGMIKSTVDASELPTPEGAAGFLQTKLQQLRDGVRQNGFLGDVGPSTPELTMDADEAYFGVFVSPDGAPPMIVALQISRYEEQVIATTVVLHPSGPVTDKTTATLGVITGQLLRLMNSD